MVVDDVSVHSKPDGMIVSFVRTHQRCPEDILSLQDAQEVATHVAGRDSGVAGPHIASGPITMEAIPLSDGNGAEARVGLPVSLVLVPTDGDERRRRQSVADRGHRVSYGERIPVEKQDHIIGIRNGGNLRSEEVKASLVGALRWNEAMKTRVVLLVDPIQHGERLERLADVSAEVALLHINPFWRLEVDRGHIKHWQRVAIGGSQRLPRQRLVGYDLPACTPHRTDVPLPSSGLFRCPLFFWRPGNISHYRHA